MIINKENAYSLCLNLFIKFFASRLMLSLWLTIRVDAITIHWRLFVLSLDLTIIWIFVHISMNLADHLDLLIEATSLISCGVQLLGLPSTD